MNCDVILLTHHLIDETDLTKCIGDGFEPPAGLKIDVERVWGRRDGI